jgi:hypothetical protein
MLIWGDAPIERRIGPERVVAIVGIGLVTGMFLLFSMYATGRVTPGNQWRPTAAQTALAQRVALVEANSLNPDSNAIATTDRWPANVASVDFVESTRESAIAWTGASVAPDDRDVLVIQMTGRFQLDGGADPVTTRAVVTLVVDASTGEVIDFAGADRAPKPPGAVPLRP